MKTVWFHLWNQVVRSTFLKNLEFNQISNLHNNLLHPWRNQLKLVTHSWRIRLIWSRTLVSNSWTKSISPQLGVLISQNLWINLHLAVRIPLRILTTITLLMECNLFITIWKLQMMILEQRLSHQVRETRFTLRACHGETSK